MPKTVLVVEDDPAIRRKAGELLARRGFDMDQIRSAARYDPDDEAV